MNESTLAALLSPLSVGPLTVRNRVMMSSHMNLYSKDGLVTDRMVEYYAARARGGVGAIVTELGPVHPASVKFIEALRPWESRIVPGLDALGAAVHRYGAKAFMQFAGGGSRMTSIDSGMPLWGVSEVRSQGYDETPHRMTTEQIDEVIQFTGRSASNVARSELDGIEFHLAHGYLAGQFLSRRYNDRTDKYGGASLDERLTFARESLEGIRAQLRSDQVLGIKMNAADHDPEGTSADEWVEVASILAGWGLLDYLTISAGTAESEEFVVPPTPAPEGLNVAVAREIKRVAGCPVYVVGRIQDPEHADQLIARGDVDGVAMARALIADPDWVAKAERGESTRIRPCIGANQGCVGYLHRSRAITCTVNPSAGLEYLELAPRPIDGGRRNIVVVGGGPAGLRAALAALQAGWAVTLYDAGDEVGGAVLDAARPASRRQLLDLVTHLQAELDHFPGLTLELGHRVESLDDVAGGADAVIVATGATRTVPSEYSRFGIQVSTAQAVVRSTESMAGRRVVLIDDDGTMAAYGVAEFLAEEGAHVDLITTRSSIGWHLDTANVRATGTRFAGLGIRVHTQTSLTGTGPDDLMFVRAASDLTMPITCDELVIAAPGSSDDALIGSTPPELAGRVFAIGDSLAPRSITEAIRDGARITDQLSAARADERLEPAL